MTEMSDAQAGLGAGGGSGTANPSSDPAAVSDPSVNTDTTVGTDAQGPADRSPMGDGHGDAGVDRGDSPEQTDVRITGGDETTAQDAPRGGGLVGDETDTTKGDQDPREAESDEEKQRREEEFAREHDPADHDVAAGAEARQEGDWTADEAGGPQVWDEEGNLVEGSDPAHPESQS